MTQRGIPAASISIALIDTITNTVLLGVVQHTHCDSCYTATLGGGAALNGEPVALPQRDDKDCFIILNSAARLNDKLTAMRDTFGFIAVSRSIAFELATMANGGHDGAVVNYQNIPLDIQAGALIAQEGGAVITDINGKPWTPMSTSLVAGSPAVQAKLLEILA